LAFWVAGLLEGGRAVRQDGTAKRGRDSVVLWPVAPVAGTLELSSPARTGSTRVQVRAVAECGFAPAAGPARAILRAILWA